ncbi:MAG: hypothetical protein BMS9Abin39_0973 [Ignavibacteria bacterium]|nr:MAG: hypothetical protein BMS9Abin39_0973 [Ignavibacteria bacterium]
MQRIIMIEKIVKKVNSAGIGFIKETFWELALK